MIYTYTAPLTSAAIPLEIVVLFPWQDFPSQLLTIVAYSMRLGISSVPSCNWEHDYSQLGPNMRHEPSCL